MVSLLPTLAFVACRDQAPPADLRATSATPEHAAASLDPDDLAFFETHIRPLFAEHCYECHSTESGKQKGGLALDTRAGWASGGDSGPALIPGDPGASLLIDAVRRSEHRVDAMPPDDKLPDALVARLEACISRGAPDPRSSPAAATAVAEAAFDLEARKWRSFLSSRSMPLVEFGEILPEGCSSTGLAFQPVGSMPTIAAGRTHPHLAVPRTIDSALLGDLQHGVLRSLTFEITKPQVSCANGSGSGRTLAACRRQPVHR